MIATGQSRKLAILQLNGGEGSRRWRVPGLKTGTGRDRSSPRLSICQGVLLMKTLEASAATDGVSLNEAAERLVKGGRPALKELKCARLTLLEFGAGRGEVEAICNVVVHCREVSAASLGSTVHHLLARPRRPGTSVRAARPSSMLPCTGMWPLRCLPHLAQRW